LKKRILSILLTLALVLTMGLVTAMPVAAATIPVNNGMTAGEINTLIAGAPSGEVVKFADGTYNLSVGLVVGAQGVTLEGNIANPGNVILDGGGSGIVVTVVADYVTVSGFTITGSGGPWEAGVGLSGVTGCTIEDNIVSNNAGIGIGLQDANVNTVRNNVLDANNCTGIGLQGSDNNIIESNVSNGTTEYSYETTAGTNHTGYGIFLEYSTTGGESSTGNTITGNTFSDNEIDGVYFGEGGDGNTLTNNTITDNGVVGKPDGHGVYFWMGGDNTVTGNTITGNLVSGIQLYLSADNTINDNNISGNTDYGINTDTVVDATDNWWGHASGPYHSSNTDGLGNPVSDFVTFDPCLTAPVAGGGGSVGMTTESVAAIIGISVSPASLDFGNISPGQSVEGTSLIVTNMGNVVVAVSAEIMDDTVYGGSNFFYTDALELNGILHTGVSGMGTWLASDLDLEGLALPGETGYFVIVTTGLVCPDIINMGTTYTGTIVFWAEAVAPS